MKHRKNRIKKHTDFSHKDRSGAFDRRGQRAGIVGICVNLALAAVKLTVGLASGSVSVMADAANNLSDCGGAILTVFGFRLSARPADKEHPFGHARYEYITGLMLAFLILMLGFSFLRESITRIFVAGQTVFVASALIILSLTVFAKLVLGIYYRRVAAALRSQTLRASSVDSFTDAAMTLLVLLGGVVRAAFGFDVDGYVGAAVAVVILIAGGKLVSEASGFLLGKAPDRDMVSAIERLIAEHPAILGQHDLMVHSYGEGRTFATVHAEIDSHTDLISAHAVADELEQRVLAGTGVRMVVHIDPVINDDEKLSRLRGYVEDLLHGISPQLGYHDLHVHSDGKSSQKLDFDLTVPVGFILPDDELLTLISREIALRYPDIEVCISIDRDFG